MGWPKSGHENVRRLGLREPKTSAQGEEKMAPDFFFQNTVGPVGYVRKPYRIWKR